MRQSLVVSRLIAAFQDSMPSSLRSGGERLHVSGQKAPETEHIVSVGKLHAWLDGGGKSPNEQVAKKRLKEMLGK
jgi:hypothetical protein